MILYRPHPKRPRRREGILLIECLVYLGVFFILIGLGFATFYVMWNNSTAMHRTADNVSAVLRAGEMWRADVRSATGTIHVQETPDGRWMKIPHGKAEIVYRFTGDEIWRKNGASPWNLALSRVKTSEMNPETRNRVAAWSWELGIDPRGTGRKLPWLFSFEAVASTK